MPRYAVWMPILAALLAARGAFAHPMGNFTVSHYAGLTVTGEGLRLHYALDHAEIPAFQERQAMDGNHDGQVTPAEEATYLAKRVPALLRGLTLAVDGRPAPLVPLTRRLAWAPGAGGLRTLRLDIEAQVLGARASRPHQANGAGGTPALPGSGWHTVEYHDANLPTRAGWKEVVVRAEPGAAVTDSTAPRVDRSRALTAYPADLLSSPPQTLTVKFRFVAMGVDQRAGVMTVPRAVEPQAVNDLPVQGKARERALASGTGSAGPAGFSRLSPGQAHRSRWVAPPAPPAPAAPSRDDRFTQLIHRHSFPVAFLPVALLIAFGLGCCHALSPGHGKTMVGAYLVGSRGTAWHAVLLGITVTISHTVGVFILGLVVLYASRWIVPERLYPWLGFASGAAITAIGLALLTSRIRGLADHQHAPGLLHRHVSGGGIVDRRSDQATGQRGLPECGRIPRVGPSREAGRSLLASGMRNSSALRQTLHHSPNTRTPERLNLLLLGVSGGIVPCPSALVVLLSAIPVHRVGLGLLLILAFSAGLALVLVAIGLLMVACGRLMERLPWESGLVRRLPVASAVVVCVLGAAVAVQSLTSGGAPGILISAATVAPLLFGFILGMKHALETDHLVAVSTIVAEQGSLARSAVVGAFWGLGHTSSLFIAALLVIVLRLRIPERVALGLEFTVALMLIGLGVRGVRLWLAHRGAPPALPATQATPVSRIGRRPYLVGLVHGMAGSAALMLLVLNTIPSPWVALFYVLLFGFGSVAGMLLMSVLLSLPLRFTARRLGEVVGHVRLAAGLASAAFGLFLSWQIGFVDGLFR